MNQGVRVAGMISTIAPTPTIQYIDENITKRQNPTDLPEILLQIGCYLSQGDLASCIRVSHVWHYYLQPLLWSNVSILRPTSNNIDTNINNTGSNAEFKILDYYEYYREVDLNAYEASVIKNIRHIRSLHIDHFQKPTPTLCQLVLLLHNHLSTFSAEEYNPTVCQILLQNNKSLRSFTCRNITSRRRRQYSLPQAFNEATEFWDVILSIQYLTELVLSGACVYADNLETFYRICERLTVLSMYNGSASSLRPPLYPLSSLKRLHLHRVGVGPLQELEFIANCPNLEHLGWRPLDATPFNPFMLHLVTLDADQFSRITSLDISQTDLSDKQLATILSSGLRLIRLIAVHSPFGDFCADQVACTMADTLVELDVRQCHFLVQSPMVQIMLMACSRLRNFRADEISVNDMSKDTFMCWSSRHPMRHHVQYPVQQSKVYSYYSRPGTAFERIGGGSGNNGMIVSAPASAPLPSMRNLSKVTQENWRWACTELEELDITFVGSDLQQQLSLNGLSLVFSQLAQLTELRRLTIGWKQMSWPSSGVRSGTFDSLIAKSSPRVSPPSSSSSTSSSLSLLLSGREKGDHKQKSPYFRAGLRRLWKLTQLRILDVDKVVSPEFSLEDVRWMCKCWCGLRRIRGRLNIEPLIELAIQEMLLKEFPNISYHSNNRV